MIRKLLIFLSLFSFSFASTPEDLKNIYKKFSQTFKNTKIQSVKKGPIKGLYQVVLDNGNIMYTDGNYLFIGHIFTFKGEDLTQKEIDKINSKKIEEIDLSKALKIGNGEQRVIEVSDPECPFCRRAETFFKDKDISRYVFFMPLPFHKNAKPLAIHILCSDNPQEEYKKVMKGQLDNVDKLIYCKKGEEKLNQMQEIAKQLNIRGTPVFWVETSQGWKKVEGANPQILKLLSKKETKEKN